MVGLLVQPKDYASSMSSQTQTAIDWTGCSLVEVNPWKVSGVPIVRGTRMQADSVVENYQSGSPIEEIADNFDIPEQTVRDLLAYAAKWKPLLL